MALLFLLGDGNKMDSKGGHGRQGIAQGKEQDPLGMEGDENPETQQGKFLRAPFTVPNLTTTSWPSVLPTRSHQGIACSLPLTSCEDYANLLLNSSTGPVTCSTPIMLDFAHRYPAPPSKTRDVRRRNKMQQTIEKASTKAETILVKLVECGKLLPGSLDRCQKSMESFMPHAMKKAGARAKTILIKLVEGGKLFPGSLDRRCQDRFERLPAWLQLEAMHQLKKQLEALNKCPPNAAEIFANILYKLKVNPPKPREKEKEPPLAARICRSSHFVGLHKPSTPPLNVDTTPRDLPGARAEAKSGAVPLLMDKFLASRASSGPVNPAFRISVDTSPMASVRSDSSASPERGTSGPVSIIRRGGKASPEKGKQGLADNYLGISATLERGDLGHPSETPDSSAGLRSGFLCSPPSKGSSKPAQPSRGNKEIPSDTRSGNGRSLQKGCQNRTAHSKWKNSSSQTYTADTHPSSRAFHGDNGSSLAADAGQKPPNSRMFEAALAKLLPNMTARLSPGPWEDNQPEAPKSTALEALLPGLESRERFAAASAKAGTQSARASMTDVRSDASRAASSARAAAHTAMAHRSDASSTAGQASSAKAAVQSAMASMTIASSDVITALASTTKNTHSTRAGTAAMVRTSPNAMYSQISASKSLPIIRELRALKKRSHAISVSTASQRRGCSSSDLLACLLTQQPSSTFNVAITTAALNRHHQSSASTPVTVSIGSDSVACLLGQQAVDLAVTTAAPFQDTCGVMLSLSQVSSSVACSASSANMLVDLLGQQSSDDMSALTSAAPSQDALEVILNQNQIGSVMSACVSSAVIPAKLPGQQPDVGSTLAISTAATCQEAPVTAPSWGQINVCMPLDCTTVQSQGVQLNRDALPAENSNEQRSKQVKIAVAGAPIKHGSSPSAVATNMLHADAKPFKQLNATAASSASFSCSQKRNSMHALEQAPSMLHAAAKPCDGIIAASTASGNCLLSKKILSTRIPVSSCTTGYDTDCDSNRGASGLSPDAECFFNGNYDPPWGPDSSASAESPPALHPDEKASSTGENLGGSSACGGSHRATFSVLRQIVQPFSCNDDKACSRVCLTAAASAWQTDERDLCSFRTPGSSLVCETSQNNFFSALRPKAQPFSSGYDKASSNESSGAHIASAVQLDEEWASRNGAEDAHSSPFLVLQADAQPIYRGYDKARSPACLAPIKAPFLQHRDEQAPCNGITPWDPLVCEASESIVYSVLQPDAEPVSIGDDEGLRQTCLTAAEASSLWQTDDNVIRSGETPGNAPGPPASRSGTFSVLRPDAQPFFPPGQVTSCSAGKAGTLSTACSAVSPPAVGLARMQLSLAQALPCTAEASSSALLDFCRRINDATSRSHVLSKMLSIPLPNDSPASSLGGQLRWSETLFLPQLAYTRAVCDSASSHDTVMLTPHLPPTYASTAPHQALASVLSMSPPSLPALCANQGSPLDMRPPNGSTASSILQMPVVPVSGANLNCPLDMRVSGCSTECGNVQKELSLWPHPHGSQLASGGMDHSPSSTSQGGPFQTMMGASSCSSESSNMQTHLPPVTPAQGSQLDMRYPDLSDRSTPASKDHWVNDTAPSQLDEATLFHRELVVPIAQQSTQRAALAMLSSAKADKDCSKAHASSAAVSELEPDHVKSESRASCASWMSTLTGVSKPTKAKGGMVIVNQLSTEPKRSTAQQKLKPIGQSSTANAPKEAPRLHCNSSTLLQDTSLDQIVQAADACPTNPQNAKKERQASTTPSGKPACFGSALWPSQLSSSSAAQPKRKQGTSTTAPKSASPLAALLGKAESSQGKAKQTGLAALVEGLPERDIPTTPKEAMGVQSQRMQISLECARDAAGLPLVNEDPPAEISAKAKSLIQRVTTYHPGCGKSQKKKKEPMLHKAWGQINHSLFMDAAKRSINPGRASAIYGSTPDVSRLSERSSQEKNVDASTAGSADLSSTFAHLKSADHSSTAGSSGTAGKGTRGNRAETSEIQTMKGLLKEERITGNASSMSQTSLSSTARIPPPQADSAESLVQSSGNCLSATSKSMARGQEQDLNSDASSSYDFLTLLAGS